MPVKAELAAVGDEMARALGAALGAELTQEQNGRLKRWGSILRLGQVLEVAENDRAFYGFLNSALGLEPVSAGGNRLRNATGRIEAA
ncbi:MAG: hypothetical protein U9R79_02835 [Armatimonadota bacterium]|nr:hypothetical protein [Armatimonadota bacterium]